MNIKAESKTDIVYVLEKIQEHRLNNSKDGLIKFPCNPVNEDRILDFETEKKILKKLQKRKAIKIIDGISKDYFEGDKQYILLKLQSAFDKIYSVYITSKSIAELNQTTLNFSTLATDLNDFSNGMNLIHNSVKEISQGALIPLETIRNMNQMAGIFKNTLETQSGYISSFKHSLGSAIETIQNIRIATIDSVGIAENFTRFAKNIQDLNRITLPLEHISSISLPTQTLIDTIEQNVSGTASLFNEYPLSIKSDKSSFEDSTIKKQQEQINLLTEQINLLKKNIEINEDDKKTISFGPLQIDLFKFVLKVEEESIDISLEVREMKFLLYLLQNREKVNEYIHVASYLKLPFYNKESTNKSISVSMRSFKGDFCKYLKRQGLSIQSVKKISNIIQAISNVGYKLKL